MGVPKKKRSYTRRHLRRANHALKQVNLSSCSNCGEQQQPHRICSNCGYYKGKRILNVED